MLDAAQGMTTGDNDLFLRQWFEVDKSQISFVSQEIDDSIKWYPLNKGGEYRKWYGNHDYIVWYNKQSIELLKGKSGFRHDGKDYYLRECITWSSVTSGNLSVRYRPSGSIFGNASREAFNKNEDELSSKNPMLYILAIMNSPIGNSISKILNPTINTPTGDIQKIPIISSKKIDSHVIDLVQECVKISRKDWNSSEISWDFSRNALVDR